ncbi:MAG: hypothetical protein JWL81_206 [Verrucomicrobiales bacterium]|nr:hypothetical protein [Verrucomicrobiales bacterium]
MSLFDFFFPEQAQASHLRTIAEQGRAQSGSAADHRERFQAALQRRKNITVMSSQEERIAKLEKELGQAALAIEALTELLEQSGVLTREALATRLFEIDAGDGVVDGRVTPPDSQEKPFTPSRSWPGTPPE